MASQLKTILYLDSPLLFKFSPFTSLLSSHELFLRISFFSLKVLFSIILKGHIVCCSYLWHWKRLQVGKTEKFPRPWFIFWLNLYSLSFKWAGAAHLQAMVKNKMDSADITKREAVRQHPEPDKASRSNYQYMRRMRTEEHIKWHHEDTICKIQREDTLENTWHGFFNK